MAIRVLREQKDRLRARQDAASGARHGVSVRATMRGDVIIIDYSVDPPSGVDHYKRS